MARPFELTEDEIRYIVSKSDTSNYYKYGKVFQLPFYEIQPVVETIIEEITETAPTDP